MRLALSLALAAPLLAALPAQAQEASAERGRALAERWCASCHVIAPDAPGADVGPAFAALAGRSDAALRGWLADPHPPMPKLELSAREIEDLVAHIRATAGERGSTGAGG